MRRLPFSLLLACALAYTGLGARVASASPSKKPMRTLAVADANGTALMLDEMRRADQRRRDEILKMEMETERRERSDRVVIFGVVAIAVTAVIMVEKRRRAGKPR
jgi:hypothetical protein